MKSGQGGRLDVPLQRRPCTRPSRAVALPRCCSWLDREATASTRPPLRHGRGTRHHWLRTAQLNAVGWAALIGLCLVAAAAGVATAWAIGVPRWSGVSLGVPPLGGVVPLDRRRWAAAMDTSVGWGGSEADVARIASEPAKRGVTTRVRTEPPTEGWPEPAYGRGGREDPQGGPALPTASLSYRDRDATAAGATLRAHGIRFPEFSGGFRGDGRHPALFAGTAGRVAAVCGGCGRWVSS